MKRVHLAAIAFVAVVLAVLIYSTMTLSQARVEVCMTFGGQMHCSTVSGATRESALRTAITNACAVISSGVTDTIACEQQAPAKVTWLAAK